jgi:hypothetical protein
MPRVNGDLEGISMLDLVMVALGLGFFALALGFSAACDSM